MTESLCMPIRYHYRRDMLPRSKTWHMQAYKLAAKPIEHVPGCVQCQADGDYVNIRIFVPCDENGIIAEDLQNDFEDLADGAFMSTHPGADLA